MISKLPVLGIVRETYVQVASSIGTFLLLLASVTGASLLVFVIWPYLFMAVASLRGGGTGHMQILMMATALLPYIAVSVVGILGAIAWHRFILLNEPLHQNIIPRRAETGSYLLRIFAVYVLFALVNWLLIQFVVASGMAKQATPFLWLVMGIGCLLLGRFVIAFPAAAIRDRSVSLINAVRKTKGNTLRLFVAWVACIVPLSVLGRFIDPTLLIGATNHYVPLAFNMSLTFASVLLTTTFASLAYGHFARSADVR